MSDGSITISAAQLKKWEVDEARLQREIAEKQTELASIQRARQAVSFLAALNTVSTVGQKQKPSAIIDKSGQYNLIDGKNMTDSMADIVNSSGGPLTKKELRGRLAAFGFTKEQLGPYFYTVIMRLKERRKIHVLPDGRITKAPQ
jgi:hypothetical protein